MPSRREGVAGTYYNGQHVSLVQTKRPVDVPFSQVCLDLDMASRGESS